jgi:sulfate adenylyltransferase subunit 1 (EFTu-like GTPase family)
MDILKCIRFATAGSVDDGKSTLIGRLLYDLDQLKTDQIEALHKDGELNLAFATDGLMEERAKGITIDVAYRYFTGHNTRFICVDAPGHEEYLKNAFTAFTQVQTVVLLVDAIIGIRAQLSRHLAICQMLKIPNIIIAINKLDAVQNPESTYFKHLTELNLPQNTICIPISALKGDNVAFKSTNFQWYSGATLIELIAESKGVNTPYPHIRFEGNIGNTFYAKFEGNTALLNTNWINAQSGEPYDLKNLLVNGKSEWEHIEGNGQEAIALTFDSNNNFSYLIPENGKHFHLGKELTIHCFWIAGNPQLNTAYQFNINQHLVSGVITSIEPVVVNNSSDTYFFNLQVSLSEDCLIEPYHFGSSIGTITINENNAVVAGGIVS